MSIEKRPAVDSLSIVPRDATPAVLLRVSFVSMSLIGGMLVNRFNRKRYTLQYGRHTYLLDIVGYVLFIYFFFFTTEENIFTSLTVSILKLSLD